MPTTAWPSCKNTQWDPAVSFFKHGHRRETGDKNIYKQRVLGVPGYPSLWHTEVHDFGMSRSWPFSCDCSSLACQPYSTQSLCLIFDIMTHGGSSWGFENDQGPMERSPLSERGGSAEHLPWDVKCNGLDADFMSKSLVVIFFRTYETYVDGIKPWVDHSWSWVMDSYG